MRWSWIVLGVVFLLACTRENPDHGLQSGETCTNPQSCAHGAYSLCTAGDQCRYRTSDGESMPCVSCQSCGDALAAVTSWCLESSGSTTGGSTTGGSTTGGSTTGGSTTGGSTTGGSTTGGSTTGGSTGSSTGGACDVLLQNCPAGATPKCAIINVGTAAASSFAERCVALNGSRANGQSCSRTDVGLDTCASGQYCTTVGRADGDFQCVAYCGADSNCPASWKCDELSDDGADGFCVPSCTLRAASCPNGLTCSELEEEVGSTTASFTIFLSCRSPGTSTAACTTDDDCAANFACFDFGTSTNGFCAPLCDNSNPCADGTFCMPVSGLPNGGGGCQ